MGDKEKGKGQTLNTAGFWLPLRQVSAWAIRVSAIVLLCLIIYISLPDLLAGVTGCETVESSRGVFVVDLSDGCMPFSQKLLDVFLLLFYMSFVIQWPFWIVYAVSRFFTRNHQSKRQSIRSIIGNIRITGILRLPNFNALIKWAVIAWTSFVYALVSLAMFAGLLHNASGEYCTYVEENEHWFHIILNDTPCYFNGQMFFEAFVLQVLFLVPAYLLWGVIGLGDFLWKRRVLPRYLQRS